MKFQLCNEFKQSQVDVNDLLQLVASTISNTVTDEIIKSTGGNLLSGETGAEIKNKNCSIINEQSLKKRFGQMSKPFFVCSVTF